MIRKCLCVLLVSGVVHAKDGTSETTIKKDSVSKSEVVENPTLKTLSGSLNRYSLYSRYSYRGGSLEKPGSAERPNIRDISAQPNLVDMSGVVGLKYRLTKQDNFSLQFGLYSTAPFHSSIDTDNESNKSDFDKNHQQFTSDDPVISYFRTYRLGTLQNISFFQYQYITRDSYRDYGGRGIFRFSQASAYKINKAMYIAGTLTYENYAYDKDFIEYYGQEVSIRESQPEHTMRANLSAEIYTSRMFSYRFITDVFSFIRYRDSEDSERVSAQQTVAMTYFYNRDISLSPNIKFLASELRNERTTVGLNLNVNI